MPRPPFHDRNLPGWLKPAVFAALLLGLFVAARTAGASDSAPPAVDFSRQVRPPDEFLAGMMTCIGSQVSQFLERRAAEGRLREQEHDRRVGREIQRGLLPRAVPRLPGFEIAGRSLAANDVGGDCFDFLPLSGEGHDRRRQVLHRRSHHRASGSADERLGDRV